MGKKAGHCSFHGPSDLSIRPLLICSPSLPTSFWLHEATPPHFLLPFKHKTASASEDQVGLEGISRLPELASYYCYASSQTPPPQPGWPSQAPRLKHFPSLGHHVTFFVLFCLTFLGYTPTNHEYTAQYIFNKRNAGIDPAFRSRANITTLAKDLQEPCPQQLSLPESVNSCSFTPALANTVIASHTWPPSA